MSDYLELPLYLEEDETIQLWVYFDDSDCIVIDDVNSDPIRYNGWWTISHKHFFRIASTHIEADKVKFFRVVSADVSTD